MNPAAISARLAFLFFSSRRLIARLAGFFVSSDYASLARALLSRFLNFLSLDSYESVLISAVVPLTSKTLFAQQLMAAAKSFCHKIPPVALIYVQSFFQVFNKIISQSPLLPRLRFSSRFLTNRKFRLRALHPFACHKR